jgi:fermentation-respiration switch protein FrsA (DUF1100 family)
MPLHDDGYIFELADSVERTPVRFANRYGIEIAADLYRAKDLDETTTRQALVIGPPHGGVKEQGPGVYANQLAQRGFVALAIDPSYNGESGGTPRHVTSPEIFAEDFSAGVDFLGTLPYVDREKIGAIGICGSGGFALNAAQMDKRIKAVATTAMYDISGVARDGWFYGGSAADRDAASDKHAQQRWADVDAGEPALDGGLFPKAIPAEGAPNPIVGEFWEFYVKSEGRGWHPRSIGAFTASSSGAHMNHGPARYVETISPRPILLVTGDQAHSAWFSEKVYEQAAEPKELLVVPGARHIDLYDDVTFIPFDRLEAFFAENL